MSKIIFNEIKTYSNIIKHSKYNQLHFLRNNVFNFIGQFRLSKKYSDRLLTNQPGMTRNYINLITRNFLELIIIIGILNPNNPF